MSSAAAAGSRVLGVLCGVSLEPDACVRRTENLFVRHGRRTLLIAKFLSGLSTITPPLAGIVGVARGQFVLLGLRIARIRPDELKRRLDQGDSDLLIVDTRSRLDAHAVPYGIPGALRITAEEIDRRHQELLGQVSVPLGHFER
jgi:hypothetical protein